MSHRPPHRPSLRLVGLVVLLAVVGAAPSRAAARPGQDPAPSSSSSSTTAPGATTSTAPPPADPGCGAVVHDPGALLAGTDALGPAAVRLVAAGVDLRVRVVDGLPDVGDVADLAAACPTWLVDGRRPARAAWLFVDPRDGGASLWYGADLRSRIGSRFHDLQDRHLAAGPVDGAAVAAVLEQLLGLVAVAEAPPDPFGCEQLLWDPSGVLGGTTAEDEAFALQGGGGDVHVRVEPPSDGDIDQRIEQLDGVCPGWAEGGERPDRQLVVMVQPSERSTGIWYGRWWDDRLEGRWERIQERDMNPAFRRGDHDAGLAAGLRSLRGERSSGAPYDPGSSDPFAGFDRGSDGATDRGSSFPVGWFVVLGLVIAGSWAVRYASWRSKAEAGETDLSWSEYAGQGSGGGYRRSRRFGSSARRSGGGSRRSSGGGRRSSGGGRRSGGGSTRW